MYIKAHPFNYIPVKNKVSKEVRKAKHFRVPTDYVQCIHMEDGTVRNIVHYKYASTQIADHITERRIKEAHIAGAELGYKEAIEQAKE